MVDDIDYAGSTVAAIASAGGRAAPLLVERDGARKRQLTPRARIAVRRSDTPGLPVRLGWTSFYGRARPSRRRGLRVEVGDSRAPCTSRTSRGRLKYRNLEHTLMLRLPGRVHRRGSASLVPSRRRRAAARPTRSASLPGQIGTVLVSILGRNRPG